MSADNAVRDFNGRGEPSGGIGGGVAALNRDGGVIELQGDSRTGGEAGALDGDRIADRARGGV